MGLVLALLVGVGLYFGAGIFSRDVNVLHLIRIGLPVIYIYNLFIYLSSLKSSLISFIIYSSINGFVYMHF